MTANMSADNSVNPKILQAINNNLRCIDNGFAEHKVAYWVVSNGIPSIQVDVMPSRAKMGAANIDMFSGQSGIYILGDQKWTIHKSLANPESIRGKDYALSQLNTVLVANSIVHTTDGACPDVNIVTGLPFDHFYKGSEKDEDFIKKVSKAIKEDVSDKDGNPLYTIASHEVMPESVAAFVSHAVDHSTGDMVYQIESGFVVVDIGGFTTDISFVNEGNSLDRERSGSRQIGVLAIRDELKQYILEEFDVDQISDNTLDKAIRSGTCRLFGKDEDVSKLREKALHKTFSRLKNYITEVIGKGADVDKILFVGGGASVMKDVIKEFPHGEVPDKANEANAIGMLLYHTFIHA